jgi:predicted dehydrogenase
MATLSFSGQSYDPDAPVSLYVDDDTTAATEDWQHGIDAPVDEVPVVEAGARHFIRVLRGEEAPVLTAVQARHVLEVTRLAYASMADGSTHRTTTTC